MHIKYYACCEEEIERTAHNMGEADCTHGAVCQSCGASDGKNAEHTYANDCATVCEVCKKTTRAEQFHVDENDDKMCDNCGTAIETDGISSTAVSGIVTGSAVVAGMGGFSLFWFVIEKKSLIELLAFFK